MKTNKKIALLLELALIVILFATISISFNTNRVLRYENNVISNDLQHTQQQLEQYIDATQRLGEDKANLTEILRNLELDNNNIEHTFSDIEEAFLVVITTKTVSAQGFYYTIRDPFDTTQSLYIYSTLDVEVGTILLLLELHTDDFILVELQN